MIRRDELDNIFKKLFNISYYNCNLSYDQLIFSELLEKYEDTNFFNEISKDYYENNIDGSLSYLMDLFDDDKYDEINDRKEIIIMMNPYFDYIHKNDFAYIITELYGYGGCINFNSYMKALNDNMDNDDSKILAQNIKNLAFNNEGVKKILDIDPQDRSLSFDPCDNTYCWRDLTLENIPSCLSNQIECLYLSHDGLIGYSENSKYKNNKYDTYDDVKAAINLFPNLHVISYCGYYSQFNEKEFSKIFTELGRDANRLICYANY